MYGKGDISCIAWSFGAIIGGSTEPVDIVLRDACTLMLGLAIQRNWWEAHNQMVKNATDRSVNYTLPFNSPSTCACML